MDCKRGKTVVFQVTWQPQCFLKEQPVEETFNMHPFHVLLEQLKTVHISQEACISPHLWWDVLARWSRILLHSNLFCWIMKHQSSLKHMCSQNPCSYFLCYIALSGDCTKVNQVCFGTFTLVRDLVIKTTAIIPCTETFPLHFKMSGFPRPPPQKSHGQWSTVWSAAVVRLTNSY